MVCKINSRIINNKIINNKINRSMLSRLRNIPLAKCAVMCYGGIVGSNIVWEVMFQPVKFPEKSFASNMLISTMYGYFFGNMYVMYVPLYIFTKIVGCNTIVDVSINCITEK